APCHVAWKRAARHSTISVDDAISQVLQKLSENTMQFSRLQTGLKKASMTWAKSQNTGEEQAPTAAMSLCRQDSKERRLGITAPTDFSPSGDMSLRDSFSFSAMTDDSD